MILQNKNKNMKVELTQKEIDRLYFDLKHYVKTLYNVDRLNELSENEKEECKLELNLIEKFSKL
jgi:hypothetical protein